MHRTCHHWFRKCLFSTEPLANLMLTYCFLQIRNIEESEHRCILGFVNYLWIRSIGCACEITELFGLAKWLALREISQIGSSWSLFLSRVTHICVNEPSQHCYLIGDKPLSKPTLVYYTRRATKLLGGILVWLHQSVCRAGRPASRLPSVVLQFLLDPFHIYTSYQTTSAGMSHVKFLAKFKNWNFGQFF